MKQFVLLIGAFAPHLAEEIWQKLGGKYSIHQHSWPKSVTKILTEVEKTIVIQVNGRLRDKISFYGKADGAKLREKVLSLPKVKKHTIGKKIKNVIIVPDRLVNIVTAPN